MQVPRLLINLKAYPQAVGERALGIVRQAERVWKETGVLIGIAPNLIDLTFLASRTDLPIFAQHVDPVDPGAHTGHISPELIKFVGARGSIINHSERQLMLKDIKASVDLLKKAGLTSVVCAPTPEESASVAVFGPDAVAIEPPELIGTGIPVSRAKPEVITESVKAVMDVNPSVKVLCGAGITSEEDVSAAVRLGSYGVLVASAVAKSSNPLRKIEELVEPFVKI